MCFLVYDLAFRLYCPLRMVVALPEKTATSEARGLAKQSSRRSVCSGAFAAVWSTMTTMCCVCDSSWAETQRARKPSGWAAPAAVALHIQGFNHEGARQKEVRPRCTHASTAQEGSPLLNSWHYTTLPFTV